MPLDLSYIPVGCNHCQPYHRNYSSPLDREPVPYELHPTADPLRQRIKRIVLDVLTLTIYRQVKRHQFKAALFNANLEQAQRVYNAGWVTSLDEEVVEKLSAQRHHPAFNWLVINEAQNQKTGRTTSRLAERTFPSNNPYRLEQVLAQAPSIEVKRSIVALWSTGNGHRMSFEESQVLLHHGFGADELTYGNQHMIFSYTKPTEENLEKMRTLLSQGVDPNIIKYSRSTLLQEIVNQRPGWGSGSSDTTCAAMVALLLERGVDANMPLTPYYSNGIPNITALHLAITNEWTQSVPELLKHNADPNWGKEQGFQTPFECALSGGNPSIIRQLRKAGGTADQEKVQEWLVRNSHSTPLAEELITCGAQISTKMATARFNNAVGKADWDSAAFYKGYGADTSRLDAQMEKLNAVKSST